tara:strand:+ start:24585 stop:25808 length:1224 start_codon:yes stop_codon:yes gene_type:complete
LLAHLWRESLAMAGKKVTTARQIDTVLAGSYSAAPNLILRVKPTGARSWVFRYQSEGKVAEIGLGKAGTRERGLAEAREYADNMRAAIRNGDDPRSILKPRHDPGALTFKASAEHYIGLLRTTKRKGKPRNQKAVNQWPSTLAKWVYPKLGDKRPADITYRDIQSVLTQTALAELPETQKRVRQRVKVILDEAAKEENEPHRYNPAASFKLEPRDPDSIKHHAAAPWAEVPAIYAQLCERDSTSALLLRWSILTAARSGEARGCVWDEIDRDAAIWTVPAERMKARKEHSIPLSAEALAVLNIMAGRKHPSTNRVFPGASGGLLSDVAVNKTLHSIRDGVTAHGFRSSFRMWGADNTNFAPEALELCLAHANPNKVEAAYQQSNLFEIRTSIIKSWSEFLVGNKAGN